MGIFNLFRRKKVEDEPARLSLTLRMGRMTDGAVFDVGLNESGAITHVFYSYSINGVEYRSSQALNSEQRLRQVAYIPGARVTVRYDPRHPGNSEVV